MFDGYLLRGDIPSRIGVFIRDLIQFRYPSGRNTDHLHGHAGNKRFIKILFHSKGMDMVDLPSLLHNKNVTCIDNTPPTVSYQ